MLMSRVGVSSAIQDSTYHENRTNADNVIQLIPVDLPDVSQYSKRQLLKHIEIIHRENFILKEKNRRLQNKVLAMQANEINYYKGVFTPEMKKAAD